MNCRICNNDSSFFYKDLRTFYKCNECCLIFTNDIPGKAIQEKHYKSQWENSDPTGWKSQVDSLLKIMENCKALGRILDFGSGSGELTKELQRRKYDVTPIDPMINGYLKDQNYPYKFDTVIAVEVMEHLPNIMEEVNEINKVLIEDGIVVCSTFLTNSFIDSINACSQFSKWWYKDDLTHVNFFCNKSLLKIAEFGNYSSVDIYEDKVFVLKKI